MQASSLCRLTFAAILLQSTALKAESNLKVPAGFEVQLYADDDLAHDIHSLTIDSLGRVVVSGPGYIRILIDDDGDGRAESFRQFADGPESGAQGLFFDRRHLVCTGDEGLLIYRDDNRDDRADEAPEVFLRISTGAEHNTHAVRKGPDGYWYVIAGNTTGVTGSYVTVKSSPIKEPHGGVLLRFPHDFSECEILADGFRNAYDFDFGLDGDVFTFESDGESDSSLPWYRPTRVMQVMPGGHAGWVSGGWKRPAYFPDMVPVLASAGRGSPTGVVCYNHHGFPRKYHGNLFVLDWTFGRILSVSMTPDGSVWSGKAKQFLVATGTSGFAPTDAEVGPDGSLFVSVGGRGTRGGVYRISYSAETKADAAEFKPGSLDSVLAAPQPLTAWSRGEWMPAAESIGADAIEEAVVDPARSEDERIRGLEVLVELFDGPSERVAAALAKSDSARLRARLAWAIGRQKPTGPQTSALEPLVEDSSLAVQRNVWEALLNSVGGERLDRFVGALAESVGSPDRQVRRAAGRVVPKLSAKQLQDVIAGMDRRNAHAVMGLLFGRLERQSEFTKNALDVSLAVLAARFPVDARREAVRLIQLGLGDVGPSGLSPAFDGYASTRTLRAKQEMLSPYVDRLIKLFPAEDRQINLELSRVLAMLRPEEPELVDKLLNEIDANSNPVDDTHYLIAAARVQSPRAQSQTRAIADALIQLHTKTEAAKSNVDSNWDLRIGELVLELCERDDELADALVEHDNFGAPGHVAFLSVLPAEASKRAAARFAKAIRDTPDYAVNNGIVFALGKGNGTEVRPLLRRLYDDFSLQDAVLLELAKQPDQQDRERYIAGLESANRRVIEASLGALQQLPPGTAISEAVALLKSARRLEGSRRDYDMRESAVELLRRQTKENFGFVMGEDGHKPQSDALEKWAQHLSDSSDEAADLLASSASQTDSLPEVLKTVDWSSGDAKRGKLLYEKRLCARCHGTRQAVGPDLAGATQRFSRNDLLVAIIDPNRDVSPRYQTELVVTRDGKSYTGLAIYQSVDGVILRDASNQTHRILGTDIESRRRVPTSLMPTGLLKEFDANDFSDLYAYLQTMRVQPTDAK